MKLRAVRPTDLTPEARIDAAKRKLADAIDELVEARIAKGATKSEWIDQNDSPLGRDRHLYLVRKGILRGVAQGHRRLVRRSDVDAYLESKIVVPAETPEDDVEAMMKLLGGGGRR